MSGDAVAKRAAFHMVHPGPVAERRIEWAGARLVRVSERVEADGKSLLGAIAALSERFGIAAGTGRIAQCTLTATRFTTGGPARDGKAANYTYIREFGPGRLPWGTFSFGRTPGGAPFVHCHAMVEAGEITEPAGGHLFPADCPVAGAFDVELFGLDGVDLVQQPDAETLHSVFEIGAHGAVSAPEALFVRVRPNEDLTEAVETACRAAGLTDAELGPSLGSLNAPNLMSEDGAGHALSSVGMEALCLSGSIVDGTAHLSGTLVDEAGTPIRGTLVRGHAPVCVTAEVLVIAR